jgi:hypothetical protein
MKIPAVSRPRSIHFSRALALLAGLTAATHAFAGGTSVSFYGIDKRVNYAQVTDSGTMPSLGIDPRDPLGSFVFDANVNGFGLASIPAPVLSGPAVASPISLILDGSDGGWHNYGSGAPAYNFASKSAMDAAYPNGTYSFNVNTTPVTLTLGGTLNADRYPAEIPTVTNGTWSGGALVLDAANSFTFNFNSFSDYSPNGAIQFSIYSTDISGNPTSQLINTMAIAAFAQPALTSYDLVGGTLQAGQIYYGQLDFTRITAFDSTSIRGASGIASFERETHFYINTIAAVPEPAGLAGWLGAAALAVAIGRRVRRNKATATG